MGERRGLPDREPNDAAVAGIESALERRARPSEFSDAAVDLLFARQDEFLEELGVSAIHEARRSAADVVSAADVERADERLRGGSRRVSAWAEAVGGVLAGAGAGEFIDVLSDEDPSSLAIALPTVFMVMGAVLLAASLPRRWRR
jgi:F0F1-type ATP synthase assembly protein I